MRRYEDDGSAELLARLVPEVKGLLERAGETMAQILEHYETQSTDTFQFESTENNVVAINGTTDSPRIAIADLAFIAVTELRQHRQRLAGLRPAMSPQEIISGCGSALRAIKKCLYAVEPLLCELERKPAVLPPRLATSLAVRRHYQKLWAFALEFGAVDEHSIRRALRGAGTRIAILVGSDVYNWLREDDRFRLRDLQSRILSWLSDSDEPLSGQRTWQDFALFVEMLRQINLREELVDHDRNVLRAAIAELTKATGPDAPDEVLTTLRTVVGIDDEIDRLLEGRPPRAVLLSELSRVLAQRQTTAVESESVAS